jgi:hypothetical protein
MRPPSCPLRPCLPPHRPPPAGLRRAYQEHVSRHGGCAVEALCGRGAGSLRSCCSRWARCGEFGSSCSACSLHTWGFMRPWCARPPASLLLQASALMLEMEAGQQLAEQGLARLSEWLPAALAPAAWRNHSNLPSQARPARCSRRKLVPDPGACAFAPAFAAELVKVHRFISRQVSLLNPIARQQLRCHNLDSGQQQVRLPTRRAASCRLLCAPRTAAA